MQADAVDTYGWMTRSEFADAVAFGLVALGMVITPGPNMIYLVSRSICQGRKAGLISLGGVALGFVFYMLCAAFGITRVKYEPFAQEPVRAAHRMLFGQDAMPVHDFARAELVLSFGADFLETWGSPIDNAFTWVQGHAYSRGRRPRTVHRSRWRLVRGHIFRR